MTNIFSDIFLNQIIGEIKKSIVVINQRLVAQKPMPSTMCRRCCMASTRCKTSSTPTDCAINLQLLRNSWVVR